MIISVTGFGFSGATAVVDYLHGYDHVKLYDTVEFQLIHQADGILDLKYHLTQNAERIACNAAISRFIRLQKTGVFAARIKKVIGSRYDELSNEYVRNLVLSEWTGRSNYDPDDITRDSHIPIIRKFQSGLNYASKIVGLDLHFPPLKKRYFSMLSETDFDSITRQYLQKLFEALNISSTDDSVLEMLFSPTDPTLGSEFFDNAKCIVVVREPRDIYIYGKKSKLSHTFMPWDDVVQYVKYYRALRENTKYTDTALWVQYEDLIYNYEEVSRRIREYLGYDFRPQHEFRYFDPNISVKYTNLKNSAPELAADVSYIEKELEEFLYMFPEKYTPR